LGFAGKLVRNAVTIERVISDRGARRLLDLAGQVLARAF
jgi:hypothetical protein